MNVPNDDRKQVEARMAEFYPLLQKKSSKFRENQTNRENPRLRPNSFTTLTFKMPSAKTSLNAMATEAKSKKKSAAPKNIIKPTPPPVTFKSTEYIQASDEDEEEEEKSDASDSDIDSLSKNPANGIAKTNGKLPAPSGSESSSESESGSDEEEDEQNNTARKVLVDSEPSR